MLTGRGDGERFCSAPWRPPWNIVFPIGGKLWRQTVPSERQFTERKTRKTQTADLGLTSNINIEGAVYDRAYRVDSGKTLKIVLRELPFSWRTRNASLAGETLKGRIRSIKPRRCGPPKLFCEIRAIRGSSFRIASNWSSFTASTPVELASTEDSFQLQQDRFCRS